MGSSRRSFLGSALALAAVVAAGATQQTPQTGSPDASRSDDPFGPPSIGTPKFNSRDILAANQKGIRKDVAQLSDIVEKLRKQLEDNDTKDVLPLDVIRETDEIQKLAKHINSLVRG